MIPTYVTIGKILMQKAGFRDLPPKDQKMFMLSQFCCNLDNYLWKDKDGEHYGRLLELQLDTKNKTCRFTQGTQLFAEKSNELMIFTNYAPNDPNIYGTHTSIKSILGIELLQFIEKNRKDIRWTNQDQLEEYILFLKELQDTFFYIDEPGTRLNYLLLEQEQQAEFPDPELILSLDVLRTKAKDYKKAYKKKLDDYLASTLKGLVTDRQAYALRVDGKLLHESEFAECYTDILYYYIFGKQFYASKHQGCCHLCSKHAILAEDISLKQKFYGTTNPLYFDSVNTAFSKYAFSMCKECYEEITVGTQYAATTLDTRILGMKAIVLPEIKFIPDDPKELIDPKNLNAAVKLLRNTAHQEKKECINLMNKLQARLQEFSILFYHKPSATSQEFVVYGLLRSIRISSLLQKTEHLDWVAYENQLGTILSFGGELSFEGFRYLLLPSKESHPQLKVAEYFRINKTIIQMLNTYLYDQKFRYKQLISQFVDIYNRKHNHLKSNDYSLILDLSPYMMSLYINHLIKFNQLEGVPIMEGRQMTTQLADEKILQYFTNNAKVYEGNFHAQGLFILGYYIAEVERKQRKKGISSTLINRLNLRGIPVQKVKSIIALVEDMRNIWQTYIDAVTDAYFRECLIDIEYSTLMPEEVVFQVLSGRAYSAYQTKLYFNDENNKTQNPKEEQND